MQPIVSDTGYRHILMMSDGRAMIAGTRIKVEYVASMTQQGESPEEICEAYAHNDLTLGQVHSALAYYYDNKELVEGLIEEGERIVDKIMKKQEPLQSALRDRARKWRAERERERLAEAVGD